MTIMGENYSNSELGDLRDFYRESLLEDVIPFWLKEGVDEEFGGYLLMRDRDGTLLDDDKSVWFQGRFATILGAMYHEVEARNEWLEAALSGVRFLREHCFDEDGRMFFMVTREGKGLWKRRYYFSEAFAITAFAQVAKATGDEELAQEARDLFRQCMRYKDGDILLEPKFTEERESVGLGVPMIFLNVAQVLVDCVGCDYAAGRIDGFVEEIRGFVRDDLRCVMECVSPTGEVIDHISERTINPGHAIEGAWFILHEAKRRGGDEDLVELGLRMLDYSWEIGWDEKHGGILYFVDAMGKPVQEYWHEMKFWWPQCEAIIATLMAYDLTGDEKYARWHRMVHDYAFEKFGDGEFGEWFGYLRRDGVVCNSAKGNHFKGPFHLPRMLMVCAGML